MADNLVKALSQENLKQIINILMTMNKSDESTGVKVYANGEEYLKDDIVVFLQENATDYTLLICTTTHTSSTDIPDMLNFATVDSTIVENFTDDEIAELFDLSEEDIVELTKLIDDVHIAINKIYSNQRTEERLTEILAEANEYATKLLGNANFLTVEIVTSESEVTSNNVLYLIAEGLGTNTYNQFILVDGEVKSLGSTSIDLSNYHTKDEITTLLADYAKKNEVLTINDVVTTLDDTVTDAQIPSALLVKEELDARQIKSYNRLSQIGLNGGNTIQEVFNALPEASMLEIGVSEYAEVTDVPAPNGILMIHKRTTGRFSIEFKRSMLNSVGANELYIGQLNGSDGSGLTWTKMITENNVSNYISNPNLLINPNFKINQREKTEYTPNWTYTVDRWMGVGAKITPLLNGGINISSTNGIGGWLIRQFVEDYSSYGNTTLTLSFSVKNISSLDTDANFTFLVETGVNNKGVTFDKDGVYSVTFTVADNPTQLETRLVYSKDDGNCTFNIDVEWVKLEIGDIATPFCPPDPSAELAKCQRYYQRNGVDVPNQSYKIGCAVATRQSDIYLNLGSVFPVVMRDTPSVKLNYVRVTTGNQEDLSESVVGGCITKYGIDWIYSSDGKFKEENGSFYYVCYEASAEL